MKLIVFISMLLPGCLSTSRYYEKVDDDDLYYVGNETCVCNLGDGITLITQCRFCRETQ